MVSVTTVARGDRVRCRKRNSQAAPRPPGFVVVSSAKRGTSNGLTSPLTPSPTRGEAPGVVATDGLAERVSAGTLFNRVTHKEIFSQTLCTQSATHIRSRGRP